MVTNNKPQDRVATRSQGSSANTSNSNSTTLKESKSRYERGMELYKEGRVKLMPAGNFKVSERFYVDTEKMQCDCPDYRTRKESCKHIFAACLFVKNRGKQKIEHLEGNGKTLMEQIPEASKPREQILYPNKPVETQKQADNKPFDRQATITRLAVLNTAVELLKTHRTPLEPETVISIAAQLEKWALGK